MARWPQLRFPLALELAYGAAERSNPGAGSVPRTGGPITRPGPAGMSRRAVCWPRGASFDGFRRLRTTRTLRSTCSTASRIRRLLAKFDYPLEYEREVVDPVFTQMGPSPMNGIGEYLVVRFGGSTSRVNAGAG